MFVPAHLVQLVEDDVAAQFAAFTAGTHEAALQYDAITWVELVEVFADYERRDGLTTYHVAEVCNLHPYGDSVNAALTAAWFAAARRVAL